MPPPRLSDVVRSVARPVVGAGQPLLKLGSTGPAVKEWQTLLTAAGYFTDITGTFDAATEAHTKQWQKDKGIGVDGKVGPESWATMTGAPAPKTYPAAYAKDAQFGRDAVVEAFRQVVGRDPTLAEAQIIQAQGHLESHYGKASYTNKTTGEKSGVINNWGAVQAGKPPCDPSKSFEATDSGAQGSYTYCYKKYATPVEGAAHMVEHMTHKRPHSWDAMKAGDIDEWSVRMHLWTPPLTKLGPGGKAPGAVQNKDPITQMPGYYEQPPGQRAKGIEERIWAIADALGEPVAAKRGGPMPAGGEPPPSMGGGGPSATKVGGGILSVVLIAIGAYLVGKGLGRW